MVTVQGEAGASCVVVIGSVGSVRSRAATPARSWAAHANNHIGVFYIDLPPHSSFTLPASNGGSSIGRAAYVSPPPHLINSGFLY